jgi:thioredoxin-like negative regulator of GroEL
MKGGPSHVNGDPTHPRKDDRPVLLFFSNRRSGPARRMASLVAWFGVTEKKRLRVVQVDTDTNAELARALDGWPGPTLVLLGGNLGVYVLYGRAPGTQISRLIAPHVVARLRARPLTAG